MARYQFWPLRKVLVHYSGVLGIVAMSVAMVLAVRPRRFERFFEGLDKTYRLHKWLGISAMGIAIFHWGWGQIPEWLEIGRASGRERVCCRCRLWGSRDK